MSRHDLTAPRASWGVVLQARAQFYPAMVRGLQRDAKLPPECRRQPTHQLDEKNSATKVVIADDGTAASFQYTPPWRELAA